ncbi:restriction endonuclease [Streptomyces sp. NBC_00868]|uniref:nSTAND3 domain-containing NTPase n=1 Tax=Streptomyces sp. NBC_00868 TaxID=2903683 RepID=UPI003863D283|nr:restriction endonuclease [Streptomyces sp. NBC_00868]
MPRNYTDLSPHDFEILVRDLLQAEFGVLMETFPQGRDGGVDIRLHRNGEESIVIQCKHSPGKTFSQIKGQLQSEAGKVSGRFSVRYILATSASITRANKAEIVGIFSGTMLSEVDILGVDDIENLLKRHPEVETRNFKLWITSSAVLEFLMNSELHRRSASLVEKIVGRRRLYVHSEAFPAALTVLGRHHVCVISGEPGIGKTTLAETLLVKLMADHDWQPHVASEDISDIERLWNPSKRQVFLYDDFLGQNSLLDNLNKNEDSRLAQVIDRVRKSDNKLLIMTTREYILRQAQQVYEPLHRVPSLDEGKIILNLAHYTREQKARIFYNHVYFADLSSGSRYSILREKRYRNIVDHPNFNPRLIELVTSNFESSGVTPDGFYDYIVRALDDPSDLWEKIFQTQLSEAERSLLLVLATVREKLEFGDLLRALNFYEDSSRIPRTSRHQLRLMLKKLHGTFLRIDSDVRLDDQGNGLHPENPSTVIGFANPSFVDYISKYLASHPDEISLMVQGCLYFEQVETLVAWEAGSESLGFAFEDIMDKFFGGRAEGKWRRHRMEPPRLASGQQKLLMEAMIRLVKSESCYWVRGATGHRRRSVSTRDRHLAMLRLNGKHERRLLPHDQLDRMAREALVRVTSGPSRYVADEVKLIERLVGYSDIAETVVTLRDSAAVRLMESLESPLAFRNVLSLLTELDAESSPGSEASEAELRDRFWDFAEQWDYEEALRVHDVSACEEAISELTESLQEFALDGLLGTPKLKERLVLLEEELAEDSEIEEDGDYQTFSVGSLGDRKSASVIRSDQPGDPIDDLFNTLA